MPIKIEGLEEVTQKLNSLNRPGAFNRPMHQAVNHINGKLQRSPTKARGAFSSMATPAQRRAYWAKVSENPALHGPGGYQRTGRLFKGWKRKVTNNGRRGIVENVEDDYASYVQGENQQPFHAATRYPRVDKVAEEEADTVVRFFQKEYERLLK